MQINSQTFFHSLAAYPTWLVVVGAVIGGVCALWLVGKLLEWSLGLIVVALLILSGAALVWLVLR